MQDLTLDDARSADPVERLLEDSWETRQRRTSVREHVAETVAALAFLAAAVPLAVLSHAGHPVRTLDAVVLVGLYAVVSRMVKFPLGAGYVVPSYLVLVPMFLLLPPATVPLLAAAGLVLGTVGQWARGQANAERVPYAIPDAFHTLGPALVLVVVGSTSALGGQIAVFVGAFVAACLFDLVSSTLREVAIFGVAPELQARVLAKVWMVDAAVAPMGLLVAQAAHHHAAYTLLILPLTVLLLLLVRDRNARIDRAHHRLELVGRERTRLQAAVLALGDAFAAKLDLDALVEILVRASVEALGADDAHVVIEMPDRPRDLRVTHDPAHTAALTAAADAARAAGGPTQICLEGTWALGLPFGFPSSAGDVAGALAVSRADRAFRSDEEAVVSRLVERARHAATDIVAHHELREQATHDPLTGLGNRRKLKADLDRHLSGALEASPVVLMLFDLDGFKAYNDTFGHPAGDALLGRLGSRLAEAVSAHGAAYRLGGDEFCVLLDVPADALDEALAAASMALEEHGDGFDVGASCGAVMLPHEADRPELALQLADERMYANKSTRASAARQQTRDVLMRILHTKQPSLHDHSSEVAQLAVRIGRRLGMHEEELDETARAAELHDVGKVGVPDAILDKPGALDDAEWEFMHQHTILGERILNAAPAMRPVARLVRASHERWDGKGYPDGVAGEAIPLGARIVAVCDAYEAMTTDRVYRSARPHADACAELRRESGHQFDPAVVEAALAEFERASTDTPAGTQLTRLSLDRVAAHLHEVLGE